MNLMNRLMEYKESRSYKNLKGTTMLRLFGLTKIPLLFLVKPSVKELTAKKCSVEIPLTKITKNHLGSMYFGALAIGADCAAGLFAVYKAEQIAGTKFNLVFKDFKANFLKRPEDDVVFICTDYEKIDDLLAEAKTTGERATRQVRIEARVPSNQDELIAEFELGLSMKPAHSRKNN